MRMERKEGTSERASGRVACLLLSTCMIGFEAHGPATSSEPRRGPMFNVLRLDGCSQHLKYSLANWTDFKRKTRASLAPVALLVGTSACSRTQPFSQLRQEGGGQAPLLGSLLVSMM